MVVKLDESVSGSFPTALKLLTANPHFHLDDNTAPTTVKQFQERIESLRGSALLQTIAITDLGETWKRTSVETAQTLQTKALSKVQNTAVKLRDRRVIVPPENSLKNISFNWPTKEESETKIFNGLAEARESIEQTKHALNSVVSQGKQFSAKFSSDIIPYLAESKSNKQLSKFPQMMGIFSTDGNHLRRARKQRRMDRKVDFRESNIAIVTTASLPWMTGTAVNPLLRAAFLAKNEYKVTLVIPWLTKEDQEKVYPNRISFENTHEQEEYVRHWVERRVGFKPEFHIRFYSGKYSHAYRSILAKGDLTSCIPDEEADVAILEEPEHLNWYHHGRRWNEKFRHVVGIMHTNYLEYARREENGYIKAKTLEYINRWVVRSHCDKVIKLSDAIQSLPRSITSNVHGVSPHFIRIGEETKAVLTETPESAFPKGAYFLGKVLWGKGYRELVDLMQIDKERNGGTFECDCYGSGEDLQKVKEESSKKGLPLQFHGAIDHADPSIHQYKVFVNPSESDVLATSTLEALAMGKIVILKDNPSNQFFKQFENTLIYSTPEEFSKCVREALVRTPKPLSEEELYKLSWEAATDRLLQAAAVDNKNVPLVSRAMDSLLAGVHNIASSNEFLRRAAGAEPQTKDISVEEKLELGFIG